MCASKHVFTTLLYKEVQDNMISTYTSKKIASEANLLKRFTQHKKSDDYDTRDHTFKFVDNVHKLRFVSADTQEDLLTTMLLSNFTHSFIIFHCTLVSRNALTIAQQIEVNIFRRGIPFVINRKTRSWKRSG